MFGLCLCRTFWGRIYRTHLDPCLRTVGHYSLTERRVEAPALGGWLGPKTKDPG